MLIRVSKLTTIKRKIKNKYTKNLFIQIDQTVMGKKVII